MPIRLTLALLTCSVAVAAALAESQDPAYRIEKEQVQKEGQSQDRFLVVRRPNKDGQDTLYVSVQFLIRHPDGRPAYDVPPNEIIVREDGQVVNNVEIHTPTGLEPLTVVLAIDISGSMAEHGKIDEAKRAARLFLEKLESKAECGLILFDHLLRVQEPPTSDRERLRRRIDEARPSGGTAYLDATAAALEMLGRFKGRRAVLLLTDGVDLNSTHKSRDVMQMARKADVPVYTIGAGEPGKNQPVATALVLDCSGSMNQRADEQDTVTKIEALHRAAKRFVALMRPGAKTTLVPFDDEVHKPLKPLTDDKARLSDEIQRLDADGETALLDATYDALGLLVASRSDGKRAVVVLTDGKDNKSRRDEEEVVERAKDAGIPLHLLGLGLAGELDEKLMRRMARATRGTYQHAGNEEALIEIFEKLSIELHDDGIDEKSLTDLADKTGGKYRSARAISQLQSIYEELAQELQTTYTVTFPSLRQEDDGTSRRIDISVWRQGKQLSDVFHEGYHVHGVVVPELDMGVYIGILGTLVVLLIVPLGLRRLTRREHIA
jgi:VWFA-related protein